VEWTEPLYYWEATDQGSWSRKTVESTRRVTQEDAIKIQKSLALREHNLYGTGFTYKSDIHALDDFLAMRFAVIREYED